MISKLVTHDRDRETAIDKMLRALHEYEIVGVETTIPFCEFALKHDAFRSGNFDTHFVQNFFNTRTKPEVDTKLKEAAAIFSAMLAEKKTTAPVQNGATPVTTPLHQETTNWERRKLYR
jgi:acetyl-CoA carboxylase, biotin carboxylase subunit